MTPLHLDPATGVLAVGGFTGTLGPGTQLGAFRASDLGHACRLVDEDRKYGVARLELPPQHPPRATVWVMAWFNRGALESLWLRPAPAGEEPATRMEEGTHPERLAWQASLLTDQLGCAPGDFPWGGVWNRYNIHYGFFDVSIWYRPVTA